VGVACARDAGAARCVGARCPLQCAGTPCERFTSPKLAFARVLEAAPQVLAVGEYHEVRGAPKVPSALKRFTVELLPQLAPRAGALIAETWMTNGRCGAVEAKATAQVEKVTKRPETTEDELTTLLTRAFDLGFTNHILVLTCDEYASMLDEAGQLDAAKSLKLVRDKVEAKALEAREKAEGGTGQRVLLLYGGAVHNDLHPTELWEEYAFGPSLAQALDGGYVELDLLVPEYVASDDELVALPWFAPALAAARAGSTVLVQPQPGVYQLLFPATPRRPRPLNTR
jgi:hypothetical protein